jgi:hypothetical protein
MLNKLKTDARLLVGQVSDSVTTGTWILVAAISLGALAVTFGLIVLAMASRP